MNMVVEGLVIATAIILYIGFEIGMLKLLVKDLKKNKDKTGRKVMPWSSMRPIQKTMIIGLYSIMIVFFIWLYNYSILGPEPGELYNLEIILVGLGIALSIMSSLWMIRN